MRGSESWHLQIVGTCVPGAETLYLDIKRYGSERSGGTLSGNEFNRNVIK